MILAPSYSGTAMGRPMTQVRPVVSWFSMIAIIIAGCCASPGNKGQQLGAEDFCAAQSRGYCAYFEGCCTIQEREEMGVEHFNCPDIYAGESYLDCMSVFEPLVNAERVVVDADALAVYRQTFASMEETCPNLYETPITRYYTFRMLYRPVLDGTVPEGSRCARNEECIEGFFCGYAVDSCSPQAGPGMSCGNGI
jgi:hypothetical protein